jgi:hypothetical protein
MSSTTEQGPGASDLGKDVIKVRKVTNWQPNFSLSGAGQPVPTSSSSCWTTVPVRWC